MRHIVAYCQAWHLTRSSAFEELLVRPLEPFLEIDLHAVETGPGWASHPPEVPLVFCQVYPPRELLDDPRRRVVWIPMWDTVAGDGAAFWEALPGSLRIVATSDAVASCAEGAGLPTLRIGYRKDPAALGEVGWGAGPVVFYWNRTGLVGPEFLGRLCRAIGARRLVFRGELDPGIPGSRRYELPGRLDGTPVTSISPRTAAEHAAETAEANVVVAPRPTEGVGMVFLEALARGAAVLAHDAPAMSEVIRHKETGYLFGRSDGLAARRRLLPGRRARFTLSPDRAWHDLASLDLHALGSRARAESERAHEDWVASLPALAAFIGDW